MSDTTKRVQSGKDFMEWLDESIAHAAKHPLFDRLVAAPFRDHVAFGARLGMVMASQLLSNVADSIDESPEDYPPMYAECLRANAETFILAAESFRPSKGA